MEDGHTSDDGQVGYQMASATDPQVPVEPEDVYAMAHEATQEAAYHFATTGPPVGGDDDDVIFAGELEMKARGKR